MAPSAPGQLMQTCFTRQSEIDSQIFDFLGSISPEDPKWTKKVKKGLRRILRPLAKSVRRAIKKEIFGHHFTAQVNLHKILRELKRKLDKNNFKSFVENFGKKEICSKTVDLKEVAISVVKLRGSQDCSYLAVYVIYFYTML